jgi:hypothetical protein
MTVDPKWVRANIALFLNALKVRHEFAEQHDEYLFSKSQTKLISVGILQSTLFLF